MATHQGTRFLGAQLRSIAEQRQRPDELVVVDDASGDGTAELVQGATRSWGLPVRVLVQPVRSGSTEAFARGIAAAEGDVIVLSDQDDVWLPNKVARLSAAFEDPTVGLAFSDAWLLDADGRRRAERLWEVAGFSQRQRLAMVAEPFGQILSRSIVSGCTLAFRADLRSLVLPFPVWIDQPLGVMTHDRWISLVTSSTASVAVTDEPLIGYRLHPDQQIGIPALQVRRVVPSAAVRWRQLAVPRQVSRARIDYYLAHLDELLGRLGAAETRATPRAVVEVEAAAAHLRRRRDLPLGHLARVRPVLAELAAGGYDRYSLGRASATADLVR